MKRLVTSLLLTLTLASCTAKNQTADQANFSTVSVQELHTALDSGAYLLDVRTPQEFTEGHIAQAINLPLDQVEARVGEVPANQPVYVICHSGNRSAQASAILQKAGKEVRNVGGGMGDWEAAGYPVVR